MNEELQQALAEIILKATESAGAAKDFVLAELPDVIQQLLMWKLALSVAYCLLSLALFVLIFLYWRWIWKSRSKEWMKDAEISAPLAVGGGFLSVGTAFWACIVFNLAWLQILIAPKVYLIEYAAELVK